MEDSEEIEQHMKQLYSLIQKGMQTKSLNTASLSQNLGVERKQLKRILNGSSPLTVRNFLRISQLLDLQETLMQAQQTSPQPEENTSTETPQIARITAEKSEELWAPAPLGNHAEQLIQLGFALGCNMLLLCRTASLNNSKVPKAVLERFQPRIPIQLEAEYHQYNKPQYYPEGLEIRLSFDALYTCFFPWNSIEQVSFFPLFDEDPQADDSEDTPERPTLRLV